MAVTFFITHVETYGDFEPFRIYCFSDSVAKPEYLHGYFGTDYVVIVNEPIPIIS